MQIKTDDLSGPEIKALLNEHLRHMHEITPPESIHALDLDSLKQPGISFWCVWEGSELMGCGALKRLDAEHAEIKSMRTASTHLRKGVARHMLCFILDQAKAKGFKRVSLETGAMKEFEPARTLYSTFGFSHCKPFADYIDDPNSVFMTKYL
ncbi:MAG: GNAT family N-acetyltransferase [Proteobacteria bacterium]|nr:GNAT family N-acetyltransferase [Pseudomonadota bacterium]